MLLGRRSVMDITKDSGSLDGGSIPSGDIRNIKDLCQINIMIQFWNQAESARLVYFFDLKPKVIIV